MQAFDEQDVWWAYQLRWIQAASDMVVYRLFHGHPTLEGSHLLVHEIEIVSLGIQRSDTFLLPPFPVQGVVVVEAYHGGGVTDKCVGVGVAPPRWLRHPPEDTGQPPHEGAFAAAGVCRQPDHHRPGLSRARHPGPSSSPCLPPADAEHELLPARAEVALRARPRRSNAKCWV